MFMYVCVCDILSVALCDLCVGVVTCMCFVQGKSKSAEAVILNKRRAAMEKELKALQSRK